MNEIKNQIAEYLKKEKELRQMYEDLEDKLLDKVLGVLLWKNENVGGGYDVGQKGVSYTYKLGFGPSHVYIYVHSSWAYGGYDDDTYDIPIEHLFSDEWKERELKNYYERLKIAEENEMAKKREQYERLKMMFEKGD